MTILLRRAVLSACVAAVMAIVAPRLALAVTAEPVQFSGKDVTLQGWLYKPAGPGPHPAVVALHGCSGLTDKTGRPSERHADWGERLAAMGYIVLFPDSYGSRGMNAQCKNGEREIAPSRERVADAKAALAYLDNRADVKHAAISLMGWSNGGSSVLYAVEPKNAPKEMPDFAKAVALYPGCRVPLESAHWRSRVPLLILIGAADDWTPAAPCRDLAAAARAQGEPVEIVTYPGAYHDFDHPNLPVHVLSGLAFTADKSGTAHTGTNPVARADAINRVPAYLAR
jgi:dienelactone hydrolase